MPPAKLRITFHYEPDVAGGEPGQFASEIDPSLHVFVTHGLGVTDPASLDDGVIVVPTSRLAAQTQDKPIVIDVPFNPAGAQLAKLTQDELWALPGSHVEKTFSLPDEQHRWPVPSDASVSFNAYVQTATQHGQTCRTRAGEAVFLLSEILDKSGAEGWDASKGDLRAVWQTTGDEPLVKGFVVIRDATLLIEPAEEHKTFLSAALREGVPIEAKNMLHFVASAAVYHGEDKNASHAKEAEKVANWLYHEVDHSLAVFFPKSSAPLGVSVPKFLERMHCPYYNTTAGMVSGSAYALVVPRAKTPADYFLATLKASLLRNDARAQDLLASAAAQGKQPSRLLPSTRAVMKQYADMVCTYAIATVYLDDFTNEGGKTLLMRPDTSPDAPKTSHVGRVRLMHRQELADANDKERPRKNVVEDCEDYKISRLGHGDDCEGVSKEIHTQLWEFRRTDLSMLPESAEKQLLLHFQAISRANTYTPLMVLAAVTNKKLDANVGRDMSDEDAMAHTYTALVPTGLLLDRLEDADANDQRFSGLSAEIRNSRYAKEYRHQAWHDELGVLICEGTARSSSLVLPITTYYGTLAEKKRAAAIAVSRFNAQVQLMQDLPLDVVQLEIPNRRIDDERGDVANDRVDASDFYKGNSAAYVSAFRDTGILDLAFAWKDETTGRLTHGIRFNRFVSLGKWHDNVRIVPYNKLNETQGAYTDSVLAQLEPIPPLRRTPDAKLLAIPADLAKIEQIFGESKQSADASTAILASNPHAMPPPPTNIVMSIRNEDLTPAISRQIYSAIAKNKDIFTSAAIHTHYLSDAPVPGDEASLPPVIVHDIELRLARQ